MNLWPIAHPDLTLSALSERVRTSPYDRLWARFVGRVREVTEKTLASDFRESFGALAWFSCTPMLPEAATLYLMTGDAYWLAYLTAAFEKLDVQSRERLATGRKRSIHSHAEMAIAAKVLGNRLPDALRKRLLLFMREVAIDDHCGESYRAYGGGSNVAWCQNARAGLCALLWGQECGHPEWEAVVDRAVVHTRCYLRHGTDDAGFSFEGTGYGHSVYTYMVPFVELLADSGRVDLYEQEPRLRRLAWAFAANLLPDRSSPINDNDIGLRGAESVPWLLMIARRFDDAELRGLWDAYQGPDHPLRPYGDYRPWLHQRTGDRSPHWDPHSAMLTALLYWDAAAPVCPLGASNLPLTLYSPGTETVGMRTSWGTGAVYLNLQGAGRSHASQTHRHADAGHFSIFAHGDYLAIDTGRYNSDEDQHSVMLVDGQCHRPIAPGWGADYLAGRVSHYTSTGLLTHARVDAAHLKGCNWAERDLLWIPLGADDAYVVVVDSLNKDNAAHSFWWQLQVHPDATIGILGDWQAQVRGEKSRLDISFTWPSAADFPHQPHSFALRQDVKEWHWPYGHDRDIAEAHRREALINTSFSRPRLIGELQGVNGVMMSLISPRHVGTSPLPVRRFQDPHQLRLEIDTPLGTDTIIAAPDHGCIETPDHRCLSPLLFIRRDANGRQLAVWSLGDALLEPRT